MSGNRGYGGGGGSGGGGFRKQKWQNRGNRGGSGGGGGGGAGPVAGITSTGGYAPPKRGSGPKYCPMCGVVAGNLAQHMVQAHDHPVET
jgi:hypothetical protein